MTSLSAGRPALQPIPLPGSWRRTLAGPGEWGSRSPKGGQPRGRAGLQGAGRGLPGRPPPWLPAGRLVRPGYKDCGGLGHGSRWCWATAPRTRRFLRVRRRFRPQPCPLRPSVRTSGPRRAGQSLRRPGRRAARSRASPRRTERAPSLDDSILLLLLFSGQFLSRRCYPDLALSPPRLAEAGPGTAGACGSPAAGGGRRGQAARDRSVVAGRGLRCAPPHTAACSLQPGVRSALRLRPVQARCLLAGSLAGRSAHARSAWSCLRTPEARGPRLLRPQALGTIQISLRAGRQRASGHPGTNQRRCLRYLL